MTLPNDSERLQAAVDATIQKHWKAYLIEGILLLILGFAAILLPLLASLTITILLGWMFLISGIAGLVFSFWARQAPGFWWSLISAVLAIAAGVVLIAMPVQGILTLTFVIGIYFLAEGVATIMYALQHRGRLSERWGWMLAAGVLDILVAFIIISGWPGTAAWAIGLLVGINLVFGGTSLIALALAARNKA
ncbi:HdeD family acid-resistance protein [Rhodopseudomonas sp.]|uniref:HdeD family acid-resistance protein n=1 Tax=Rhodopseudomonas sp. TaxID=1078 RepID=UPI003B3AD2EF